MGFHKALFNEALLETLLVIDFGFPVILGISQGQYPSRVKQPKNSLVEFCNNRRRQRMGQRVDAQVEAAMRRAKVHYRGGMDGWMDGQVMDRLGLMVWVHTTRGSTNILLDGFRNPEKKPPDMVWNPVNSGRFTISTG